MVTALYDFIYFIYCYDFFLIPLSNGGFIPIGKSISLNEEGKVSFRVKELYDL